MTLVAELLWTTSSFHDKMQGFDHDSVLQAWPRPLRSGPSVGSNSSGFGGDAMYLSAVRSLLDHAIPDYARFHQISTATVCGEMAKRLNHMAPEHRKTAPQIPYEDPICRLAYIYRHVAANATLFQWLLRDNPSLRSIMRGKSGQRLRIAALGGGPDSELLGLIDLAGGQDGFFNLSQFHHYFAHQHFLRLSVVHRAVFRG
jgi:hypothetical protein